MAGSEDEAIAGSIRQHGWHAIHVGHGPSEFEPAFTYTIGFCDTFGHPECVFVWPDGQLAHGVLAAVAQRLRNGERFEPGQSYEDLIEGYRVAVRPVHQTQLVTRLGYAMGYYRRVGKPEMLRAVQLFWPDSKGRFPFEVGCDPMVALAQPRLELVVTPGEMRRFMREYGS
jgi:hypothetical protein